MPRLERDRLAGVEPFFEVLGVGRCDVVVEVCRSHPDQLVPRVSEAATRLTIHIEDYPLVIEEEERVRCVVHEHPETLLALAQRLLGALEIGDIGACSEPFDDDALFVPNGYAARLEPEIGAVPRRVRGTRRHKGRGRPRSPSRIAV